LNIEPMIGVPYLPQKLVFEFNSNLREEAIELELDPAAEVVFEAVEKGTGKSIAGVAFLGEPPEVRERKRVQSQLSFVDNPQTGTDGRMQAFLVPGQWRFFVERTRSAHDFEPLAPISESLELAAGKPTHVRSEFTEFWGDVFGIRNPWDPVVGRDRPGLSSDSLSG
jgi:hypothetical protein